MPRSCSLTWIRSRRYQLRLCETLHRRALRWGVRVLQHPLPPRPDRDEQCQRGMIEMGAPLRRRHPESPLRQSWRIQNGNCRPWSMLKIQVYQFIQFRTRALIKAELKTPNNIKIQVSLAPCPRLARATTST